MKNAAPWEVEFRRDAAGVPYLMEINILGSQAARERGIYNVQEMLSVLQNNHPVELEAALQLFHVAEFELWHGIAASC